jgi:hypothetical protein
MAAPGAALHSTAGCKVPLERAAEPPHPSRWQCHDCRGRGESKSESKAKVLVIFYYTLIDVETRVGHTSPRPILPSLSRGSSVADPLIKPRRLFPASPPSCSARRRPTDRRRRPGSVGRAGRSRRSVLLEPAGEAAPRPLPRVHPRPRQRWPAPRVHQPAAASAREPESRGDECMRSKMRYHRSQTTGQTKHTNANARKHAQAHAPARVLDHWPVRQHRRVVGLRGSRGVGSEIESMK